MLGDCYAAAVVEHLSKKELMALDAAAYQVCNSIHITRISFLKKNSVQYPDKSQVMTVI